MLRGALMSPEFIKEDRNKTHELVAQLDLLSTADLHGINLAKTLRDGQKITLNPNQKQSISGLRNIATYNSYGITRD